MKKYFIVLLALVSTLLQAQSTIVSIGSGTANFSTYPFASAQKYGWATQIYKASDIGVAGTLTSISFEIANTPSNITMNNQKIYVRHVTSSNYTDIAYPTTTGFTLVYDGSINYNGSGWKQINFTTNFNYNGVDDLEFLFENRSNATQSSVQFKGTTTMPEYRLKRDYSGTSFPTTSTAPATKLTYQINAQLTIIGCFFNEGTLSTTNTTVQAFQPVNLNLSGQESGSTIQWQRSTDNINYTVIAGVTGNTHSETMLSTPLYFRTIATKDGCSKFSNVVTINPDACYTQTATIGTGTDALERSPANGYYNYSWSSTIYKASEIGGAGKLSGISYYVNNSPSNYTMNNQKIYVRHTTASNYSTSSYPTTTGFTLIYDGSITYNGTGWKQIPFTTAFDYDGTNNLEFLFENRDASGTSGFPTFRYTVMSGDGNRTQRDYLDASFPSTASTNLARVTNVPNIKLTKEHPGLTITPVDVTILQGNSVQLTATGGVNYAWNPLTGLYFGESPNFSSPSASPSTNTTYSITATTPNGCVKTVTSTVNVITFGILSSTVTDVDCSTNAGGSITISPAGGTTPYTYKWSNGSTSQNISNLSQGVYTVTIKDAANNIFSKQFCVYACAEWIDLNAVTFSSNTLIKTAVNNWENAGGKSKNLLYQSTVGGIKYQVENLSKSFVLGLSEESKTDLLIAHTKFAFALEGSVLKTYVDGTLRDVFSSMLQNDVIEIVKNKTTVDFLRNGKTLYSYSTTYKDELKIDFIPFLQNSAVSNIKATFAKPQVFLNTTLLNDTIIGNDSTIIICKLNGSTTNTIVSGGIQAFDLPSAYNSDLTFEFNFIKETIETTNLKCVTNRYGVIESITALQDTIYVPIDSSLIKINHKRELMVTPFNAPSDVSKLTTYLNLEGGLVLSPNADGNYDYLTLHGAENINQFSITIYNLQHQQVYQSNQKNFQWNGKDPDAVLTKGTYNYVMNIDGTDVSGYLVIDF